MMRAEGKALRGLEKTMTELESEIRELGDAGYEKDMRIKRSYLHGMIAVLTALGYGVLHDSDGDVVLTEYC